MAETVAYGTSETRDGDHHVLRYELHLPHPAQRIWAAVTTPEGLREWLAAADELEHHIGGAVALRWLNTDAEGRSTVATGTVTAWDPEHVAEYTVSVHGRIRFHLEAVGTDSTVVRFTNERRATEAELLDCLAGWHSHLEYLADALDGRPHDASAWSDWTADRWHRLRGDYAARA
ncbi:SRPBCC domain-containing protein [Streptomyces sp. SYSU K21746]